MHIWTTFEGTVVTLVDSLVLLECTITMLKNIKMGFTSFIVCTIMAGLTFQHENMPPFHSFVSHLISEGMHKTLALLFLVIDPISVRNLQLNGSWSCKGFNIDFDVRNDGDGTSFDVILVPENAKRRRTMQ